MTDAPSLVPDDIERPAPRETLWVTDAELIRRMGVPEKIARDALRMLDNHKESGFPQKQALWGGRRYWPDVRAYLDRRYGFNMNASLRGREANGRTAQA